MFQKSQNCWSMRAYALLYTVRLSTELLSRRISMSYAFSTTIGIQVRSSGRLLRKWRICLPLESGGGQLVGLPCSSHRRSSCQGEDVWHHPCMLHVCNVMM